MFRNGFGGFISSVPPATKNLIIINVIIWAIEAIFPRFGQTIINVLGLHFVGSSLFNPIQIITYLFVHNETNPWHLLFNMFSLWMFGSVLERVWGTKRYLLYYFICGVGAAFIQEIVYALSLKKFYDALDPVTIATVKEQGAKLLNSGRNYIDPVLGSFNFMLNGATIGASGAIYGLLLGYAFVFPNQPLYLFFIPYPIKAKYMMIGYGVIEFFLGFNATDSVAHFAHLGGMLFGIFILLYWRKNGTLRGNFFH